MKRANTPVVNEETGYLISETELEKAREYVTFYDVILDDAEAIEFDKITQRHYEETIEYERKHRKG